MQGDLISKKKIRDYIKRQINPYGNPFEGTAYELGLKIMKYIDNVQSHYDVERVLEEMEEYEDSHLIEHNGKQIYHCVEVGEADCHGKDCLLCVWDKAKDIIRNGGKE